MDVSQILTLAWWNVINNNGVVSLEVVGVLVGRLQIFDFYESHPTGWSPVRVSVFLRLSPKKEKNISQ